MVFIINKKGYELNHILFIICIYNLLRECHVH